MAVSLPARGVWIEIRTGNCMNYTYAASLPARGVWIEIKTRLLRLRDSCRSPQGECGLKCIRRSPWLGYGSRSPQGECGLKFLGDKSVEHDVGSLPARGVWIEKFVFLHCVASDGSLPARGVWIEITQILQLVVVDGFAPRKGSVD